MIYLPSTTDVKWAGLSQTHGYRTGQNVKRPV